MSCLCLVKILIYFIYIHTLYVTWQIDLILGYDNQKYETKSKVVFRIVINELSIELDKHYLFYQNQT